MESNNISAITSIFIGVVSGIITSIIVWVVVRLFKNTLLPWYSSFIYQGQDISGDWDGYYISPKDDASGATEQKCSIIHLEQKGNEVSGNLILIKQPAGQKESKKYDLKGIFFDNCLVLTFKVVDKTRFGAGTFVSRLVDDGQKLDGYWTAINTSSSNVFSITEYWTRKK